MPPLSCYIGPREEERVLMSLSGNRGRYVVERGKGRTARNLAKAVAPGRRRGATALLLHRTQGGGEGPDVSVRQSGPVCG